MHTAGRLIEATMISRLSIPCSRTCHSTANFPIRASWKVDTQAIARRRRHWKTSKQRGASISANENLRRGDGKTSRRSDEDSLCHATGEEFTGDSLADGSFGLNLSSPPPEGRNKDAGPSSSGKDRAGNAGHYASSEAPPAMGALAGHGDAGSRPRDHPLQEAAMQYAALADTLWDNGHATPGDGSKVTALSAHGKKGAQARRGTVTAGSISNSGTKDGKRGEAHGLRQGMGMPPQVPQGLARHAQDLTASPSPKPRRRVPAINSTSERATRHTGASEDRAEAAQRSHAGASSDGPGGGYELPEGHPLRALYGASGGDVEEILSELDWRESLARSQGMSLVEMDEVPGTLREGGDGDQPQRQGPAHRSGAMRREMGAMDEETFVNRTKGEFLRQRLHDMSQALSSAVYPPRSDLPPSSPPRHEAPHSAYPPGHPLHMAPSQEEGAASPQEHSLELRPQHELRRQTSASDVREMPEGHPLGRAAMPMDAGADGADLTMASRHPLNADPSTLADALHAGGPLPVMDDSMSVGSLDAQVDSVLARLAQAQVARQAGGVPEYTEAAELPEAYGERELKLAMEMARVRQEMSRRDQDFELLRGVLKEAKAKLKKLKSTTMAEIARAQATLKEQDRRLAVAEASLSQLARVTFEWKGHASRVQLAGAFDGWTHFIDLTKEAGPDARGDSSFAIELRLYPGTYECKFLVDGQWMIDKTKEVVRSGNNENNLVRVTMPAPGN
eukprot:jgi/Mesvir1/12105/Mv00373-RA.3